ncbi:hypothetical protein BAMY6614_10360 [Bacillus amyloliquefaciens UMAF6614]|nr:hypothetical protein BAMY6614_10360 [Bacillus amyloliquefaciens UMAF6614]
MYWTKFNRHPDGTVPEYQPIKAASSSEEGFFT